MQCAAVVAQPPDLYLVDDGGQRALQGREGKLDPMLTSQRRGAAVRELRTHRWTQGLQGNRSKYGVDITCSEAGPDSMARDEGPESMASIDGVS